MKKKNVVTSFLILILCFVLIACSSNKTEGDTTSKDDKKVDPFDHSEKYTITGMTFRFGDPPPATSPGLDLINEKFNVDYQPQIIPQADYIEKSSAAVAAGDMPDMIGFQASDTRFYQWAKEGAFLPLDDYLKEYETLGGIPDYVYSAFKVDGKVYGIPRYSQPYPLTPIIRKDWLDNLGLEVPTSYEELEEVAIAFTKNDPDKNGQNDTYGLAIGQNINPDFNLGAYWDANAWYHKNKDGEYIPGIISEGRKEVVQFLADLYKEDAMTKDFAVLNWTDTNGEFYKGKAGIFVGGVAGMSEDYLNGLMQINPEAKFIALPPFEAPDKSKGFTRGSGYSGILALNAKLADDPAKIYRALEMIDFGKQFYPADQKNPENEDFDFMYGKAGTGYNMVNNAPVRVPEFSTAGFAPSTYFLDNLEQVPTDAKISYADAYKTPAMKELTTTLQTMFEANKMYINPSIGVISETNSQKGAELTQFLINEQSKMIAGQRPISDWDKLVDEYMQRGGKDVIKEVNQGIKGKGYKDRQWE
ncbi:extracellular solute-binding protein [Neobacillus niacini]|uniref:extracellular solute-binding protein n=1 Tax=Neobacillus niacini TaxID=86668 RepID=UPI002FFF9812